MEHFFYLLGIIVTTQTRYRIYDHDRHANIKFEPDINKNKLNF